MTSTYIIIVTYNARPWLHNCLASINFEKYTVVVVDNNSKDDTVKVIKNEYPQVKLFEEQENLGFGQANNKGISYALNNEAEHVFLLNQDAYLVDDCLEKLLHFQKKNTNYGVLSPIHCNADLNRLDRKFSYYLRYDNNPNFVSDHVLGRKLQTVYDVPFVNAAGWLINKQCLMAVGGFDPIFFHYGEDDNYCQRVIYHGLKIGVIPNTFMIHDRENRKETIEEIYSEPYFERQKRSLKLKFANINKDCTPEFEAYIKKLKRKLFKARLKQDRDEIKGLKRMLRLLNNIKIEIKNSISINKRKHPNYLDISNQ